MIYNHIKTDFFFLKKLNRFENIFKFLDLVSFEIKKNSKKTETKSDIIFIDYKDQELYIIDINKANEILSFYYAKFFINPILNKIEFQFELYNSLYFSYLNSKLFVVLKKAFILNKKLTSEKIIALIIKNSNINDFSSEKEYKLYCSFVTSFLNTFKFEFLLSRYKPFFHLSSEIIKFTTTRTRYLYCRIHEYKSFCNLIKNNFFDKKDPLEEIDLSLQFLIICSFINSSYCCDMSKYYDNSYINHKNYFLNKDSIIL